MVTASVAMAQSGNSDEARYSALLQQIADKELEIIQKQAFISRQLEEIASLNAQIESLDGVKKSIAPMVEKMTAAIEDEISADYPFRTDFAPDSDNRLVRLRSVKKALTDPKATIGEKYRRILNLYKIEVNYGKSLEAYKGNHPVNPMVRTGDNRYEKDEDGNVRIDKVTGQKIEIFDGNYLRYGRTAFVYLNADGTKPLYFDLNTRAWKSLPKSRATDVRRAIRMSNGEIAPSVVTAPVFPMP